MAQAKFKCVRKSGIETFTVVLEPVLMVASEEDKARHARQAHSELMLAGKDTKPGQHVPGEGTRLHADADRTFFADVPHGSIQLSALTKEAAAQFEEGKVTVVTFALEG